jgi:plastocyanin
MKKTIIGWAMLLGVVGAVVWGCQRSSGGSNYTSPSYYPTSTPGGTNPVSISNVGGEANCVLTITVASNSTNGYYYSYTATGPYPSGVTVNVGNAFLGASIPVSDSIDFQYASIHTLIITNASGANCTTYGSGASPCLQFNASGVYYFHCGVHSSCTTSCSTSCTGMAGAVTVN